MGLFDAVAKKSSLCFKWSHLCSAEYHNNQHIIHLSHSFLDQLKMDSKLTKMYGHKMCIQLKC